MLLFFYILLLSAVLDSFLLYFNMPVLLQQQTRGNWVSSSLVTADGKKHTGLLVLENMDTPKRQNKPKSKGHLWRINQQRAWVTV